MPIPCLPTYSSLCPRWEGPTGGPLPGVGNSLLQPDSRERCNGSDWYPSIRLQGGVSSLAALPYQVPTASFLPSCSQQLEPGVSILGPTPRSGDGPELASPGTQRTASSGLFSQWVPSSTSTLCPFSPSPSPGKLFCKSQPTLPPLRLFLTVPETQSPR